MTNNRNKYFKLREMMNNRILVNTKDKMPKWKMNKVEIIIVKIIALNANEGMIANTYI